MKVGSYDYSTAVKECDESGGRLVTLQNEEMNSCVKQVIRDLGLNGISFWIGLMRIGVGTKDFIWSDGKIISDNDFTDWGERIFLVCIESLPVILYKILCAARVVKRRFLN